MKKGISLIVLVITIIVMIIIAGAIIISLNSSNVIDKANDAVTRTDVANLNDKLTLAYVDLKTTYPSSDLKTLTTIKVGDMDEVSTLEAYYTAALSGDTIPTGYTITVADNGSATLTN